MEMKSTPEYKQPDSGGLDARVARLKGVRYRVDGILSSSVKARNDRRYLEWKYATEFGGMTCPWTEYRKLQNPDTIRRAAQHIQNTCRRHRPSSKVVKARREKSEAMREAYS